MIPVHMNVHSISRALARIHEEEATLLEQLALARSRLRFDCGCGKRHAIKDCVAIQTHWYESPHGCMGGDYWWRDELQIICPDTDNKNRLVFTSKKAKSQFEIIYTPLFKEVIEDYDKDKRRWWINDYFRTHYKRFGLEVE